MPFDPRKPLQTRTGEPATLLADDVKMAGYPLVAVITEADGGQRVDSFTTDGAYEAGVTHSRDLVNVACDSSAQERRHVHTCAIEQLSMAAAQFENAASLPATPLASHYARQARELRVSIRALEGLAQ